MTSVARPSRPAPWPGFPLAQTSLVGSRFPNNSQSGRRGRNSRSRLRCCGMIAAMDLPIRPARDDIAPRLLAWYGRNRRRLPWRALPGERADPYRVWLSEIMLQQTTVAAVEPYFREFLARWPTIADLAAADLDEVLHAWQGLGYYARARNLHRTAMAVASDHGGRLPDTEAGLRTLPGIGAYTSAAIAAIAFDRKATPVDGNIERVVARLFAVRTPLPRAKPELKRLAEGLTPSRRA